MSVSEMRLPSLRDVVARRVQERCGEDLARHLCVTAVGPEVYIGCPTHEDAIRVWRALRTTFRIRFAEGSQLLLGVTDVR